MKKEEEVKIVKYNQKKTFVESCAIFFPRLGGFLRSTRSMSNNYLSLSNWFGGERERERGVRPAKNDSFGRLSLNLNICLVLYSILYIFESF